MAERFLITDECVLCGLCAEACPARAIRPGAKFQVDPAACTGCGVCVEVCPQECILAPEAVQWIECPGP